MKEFSNFLTKDECIYLIDFIKNSNNINNVETNRQLDVYTFDKTNTIPFLNQKLNSIGIINSPPFNINKYIVGSFFQKHVDIGGKNDPNSERMKTLIVNLSDKKDYVGGDLIIDNNIVSKEIGSGFLFSSNILHELKVITYGVRYSLVIWLKNNNFKKSIL
jgi:predicted 2-oxoglutarate/Fe(II)-dependent dioxygenase YbiX